ncbi:leukotoxin LktA family filamentous adhesin [Aquibium carbonis]|uniref:leukotoxin LktA family filamentous adhesin n=1 Tax=Aquibium carbonis TaxID=2495581 RepID=UPI00147954DC|nr:leukotoxin LktA family filamentous adhesin [Aquibium carbonis]
MLGRTSPFVIGLMAGLVPAGPAFSQAVNLEGGVTNILADGRTRTRIETTGQHTKIHTDTVSNGTGFNSFSDFRQAAGSQVDLYVPDNAGNLVNIVRNGPVVVDGILNAYKDGKIGGNVFFSSSQGFIVGANGTINVGSLTVNTPTQEFLESVIGRDGTVNNVAASQLMGGVIPISPDGVISIAGQINAEGGITLQGHRVSLYGGGVQLDGVEMGHREKFNYSVNVGGMAEGAALVSRGGSIAIVAEGDARLGGRIDASAAKPGRGGKIKVTAGRNIELGGGLDVRANALGDGDGGTIEFIAQDTLVAQSGARFTAVGAGHGDGGFVELSGKTALIGGIQFDLSSEFGRNGTLLIDPYDLYIGGSVPLGTTGDFSLMGSITSNGADVVLQADNSITVVGGGFIDTTSASGDSGDITLEAPFITIADGAWLTSEAVGGAAGDILLDARAADSGILGAVIGANAAAGIVLADGSSIKGGNISLTANAHSEAGLSPIAVLDATATIVIGSASIAASGHFLAHADASVTADGGGLPLPFGVIVADVVSSVTVGGTAQIGAASASLLADAAVTVVIATQSLVPANSAADGAVAVSTIDSKALVDIAGNASLTITNALVLAATNDVISHASAVPVAAAFGASVGVSVVTATTTASIGGNAGIATGSLALGASTTTDIAVTAAAAAGGATEPQEDSQTAGFLDQYGENASTDEGGVSVVGALAVSDLTSTTLAQLASSVELVSGGTVSVSSSSTNGAALVADGSAVESSVGVGVAVGVNIARIRNDAIVAQEVTATGLTLSAVMNGADGVNRFSNSATSGAGATNVGIAGSFAVNIVDTQASATLTGGAQVNLGGGSLSLTAANATDVSGEALPSGDGATGGTVGVGASVALNIVANRAVTEVADDAAISAAEDVTLDATGVFSVSGEASAGSAGGISITPSLALSLINNTTTARLGTGSTLLASGAVSLTAIQQSSITTKASGKAAGANVAIGAAIAIAIIDDVVLATTARSVDADGDVTFVAMGASFSELTAEASAVGAAAEDEGSGEGEGGDVNSQVTGKIGSATEKQEASGVGSDDQRQATSEQAADEDGRSAETSEGGVSVAAAVAVNVQGAKVTAGVPDGVAITSGGSLTIRAAGNTEGKLTADGSAVGEDESAQSAVGIGAAVAVNKVSALTVARLGAASHDLNGLTIEATSLDIAAFVADPTSDERRADIYEASASSGAGASNVGIAGSLALNLIDTEKSATVAGGASLQLNDGAIVIAADNQTETTGKALPVGDGATGGKVGIGASVAINIVANRSMAIIESGAVLDGTGSAELSASGGHSVTTEAESGSAGGVAVTPVLGLSMVSNTTMAMIGTGSVFVTSGGVSLAASQESTVSTSATAAAAGGTAAIGASLALALVDDVVSVTTLRSIDAGGDVSLSASGISTGTLVAKASASGAAAADDEGEAEDGSTVDDNVDQQLEFGGGRQKTGGVGNSAQQDSTTSGVNDKDGRSAKSEEGKVSVAAAVAVNVTNATVTAGISGVNITASGNLTIASAASVSGDLSADGSAADSQVGIGVAVAVNAVNKTNAALLGTGTHSANGVSVSAVQASDASGVVADVYVVKASSGAGGSKVGIAGALALNLIDASASARIDGTAVVNAGSGASEIKAEQDVSATAEALPSGDGTSGGKVGIGASVALNLITATTLAELADGASFEDGEGLAVSATTGLATITNAAAGSSGGIAIDAVVALAMLDTTTTARIGSGTGLDMATGAVTVTATSTGAQAASADGAVKAGNVGVGAAAAVIIGGGDQDGALKNTSVTSATLARNVSAGSVEIAAVSERTYVAEATATAGGGKSDADDSDKPPAKPATSTNTLSTTESYQQGTNEADAESSGTGSGSGSGGSGGSGKKVQVAAAVGVAAAQDVVSATIAGGLTINATGAVSVTGSSTIDMATLGSGQAGSFGGTGNAQVGVGIGVALGIITGSTSATIGDGVVITQSGSVTVSTTTRENVGADFMDRLTARAIAGASSSKVSVAGAIAVGISLSKSDASIGDDVEVDSSGAVTVSTDNQSRLAAKAMAASYTSGSAAIGASIATVYSDRSQIASVGAGNSITATDVSVTSINREVDGTFVFQMPTSVDEDGLNGLKDQLTESALLGASNYYAEAMGGAAAPSGVAVQGSFAVMVFSDDVKATIGESANSTAPTDITASGAVTLSADSAFTARALTGGIAVGSSVGVGVSATVIVASGQTQALLAGGTVIADSASFLARATASQDFEAYGVSAAGASTAGIAGVAVVITSENVVEALVEADAEIHSSGAVSIEATNDFTSFALAGGAAAGGTAGIGAAGAVVVVDNVTRAALGDGEDSSSGVVVMAGGAVGLSATATQTATTIAAAGGAAGTAGVGAGGAVYVLGTVTEAFVGDHARIGGMGSPVGALSITASDESDLATVSGAFGGGGSAGVGAAAAVGVLDKAITARIGIGANVTATDVSLSASDLVSATTVGVGVGVGGAAGVAGAVGVFSVSDTTTALIASNATVHSLGNVAVVSVNGTSLDTISGGAGIGGSAGVGASVSVNLVDTTTHATIDGGANVTALGQGAAHAYLAGYQGNFVNYGSDDDFEGPDLEAYELDAATGSASAPMTAEDAFTAGLSLLTQKRVSTGVTGSAHGVIVNAATATEIRSLAVSGAVGGAAGVALSADVPIVTTDTQATIGINARINQGAGTANAAQSVTVAAASDFYYFGLAGSAAGGGAAGVGGGAAIAIINLTTNASIGDETLTSAAGDIVVAARAREDMMASAAAGAFGGYAGVAGGVTTIVIDTHTTATLDGVAHAGGNVDVIADDQTRISMLAGSIGVSGAVGIGASIGVVQMDKTVSALIASGASVTALGGAARSVYSGDDFMATRQASGLNVLANSNQSVFTLAVAGGGGLFVGAAGAVTLELIDVLATATIGNNARINEDNTGAAPDQDVVVTARDSTSTLVIDGAIGLGLVGVAGAVDVAVFRNSSAGTIGDGALVNAHRNVSVSGLSNKATNSTTVSAAGGIVGVAAGISIYSFGDGVSPDGEGSQEIGNATEDGSGSLTKITEMADSQGRDGSTNEVLSESSDERIRSISQEAQDRRGALDFTAATELSVPGGTSANIGSATINAGGKVGASSFDQLNTRFNTGAIAGGIVGVGAGIGVVTVDTTNTAQLSGTSTITAGSLAIMAMTDHTVNGLSIAGSIGYAAALSADVAILRDRSRTYASVTGSNLVVSGGVAVNATSVRTLDASGYGAAVAGAAAAGVSVVTAEISGEVEASIEDAEIGSLASRSGSVEVVADATEQALTYALAAAGGIGIALQGSVAESSVSTTVSGTIENSNIYTSGAITLGSEVQLKADAEAKGFALGGVVAAGASIATAKAAATNTASVSGSTLDGGSIAVTANLSPMSGGPAAKAQASGSSGALVGVTATEANATTTGASIALVQTSALKATGLLKVEAIGNTDQYAYATGKTGGLVAIGSNTARARSTTTTLARFVNLDGLEAGSVELHATGFDSNFAGALAGTGGVVAGTASEASTWSTSTTRAAADTTSPSDSYTMSAVHGLIDINATHTSLFGGTVDSTQASLAGASGARLNHTVISTVDAHLGDNAVVRAANLAITARNQTHSFFVGEAAFGLYPGSTPSSNFNSDNGGWNVNSGSGGLVDAPAGSIAVQIAHTTGATIGANADIHLLAQGTGMSLLSMEAYNEVIAHQKAKLDSGGAVAIASTEIAINAVVNATVSIGDDSDVVVDLGDIDIAAWGQADIEARSVSTTSGVAGAPSGKAYAIYTSTNNAVIGDNVLLQASSGTLPTDGSLPTNGTISVGAGGGLEGRTANLRFRTTVDLFNNTAIPIDSSPDARILVTANSFLTTGEADDPRGIRSAGDITLKAVRGNISTSAVGIGKNIYLEALSEVASAVSNLFGGGDVTFEIHGGSATVLGSGTATINGLVLAGLQRHRSLTLDYTADDCDIQISACMAAPVDGQIGYQVSEPEEIGTTILERLAQLELLLLEYGNDLVAKGAYQSEIRFLQTKLAALGLGSFNSNGDFVPNQYVAPNPVVIQFQIDAEKGKLTTVNQTMAASTILVTEEGGSLAENVTSAYSGIQSNSMTVASTIATVLASANDDHPAPSGASAEVTNRTTTINNLIATGNGHATEIQARIDSNETQQTAIDTNLAIVLTQQAALEAARISGDVTAELTAQLAIDNAIVAIDTALGVIASNNTVIETRSAQASTNAAAISTAVESFVTWANTTLTTLPQFSELAALSTNVNAIKGAGGETGLAPNVSALATAFEDYGDRLGAQITVLRATPAESGTVGGINSLSQYVGLIDGLTENVASYTALLSAPTSAPMARSIIVEDTMARIANVSVYADRLVGSGSLQAPGDARITITNNTANSLKLGSLIIPTYDAGNVRFNGVLVHDEAGINSLNPNGTAGVGLRVVDRLSSTRSQVTIASNYNPDSLFYQQPPVSTPQVAPDLVLTAGSKIMNPSGAVNITSAAGNIYIQGEIEAGSLTIVAKNGDFVSSYVNGFSHVGGDPASFNSFTNVAEAGRGIIVNGSISIAARYLNINSTIQSGIAEWTLDIGANPLLTTNTAAQIGKTQTQVNDAVQAYLSSIANVGGAATSPIIDLGGGVILNMGPKGLLASEAAGLQAAINEYLANTSGTPVYNVVIGGQLQSINIRDYISGGVEGRLEFTMDTLQAFLNGSNPAYRYALVTGSDVGAIGATYDAAVGQYVVDGTRVNGGYIQLYGQIINTAYVGDGEPVGRLNVLDGFGTINITNSSDIPVILQALHTGDDTTGTLRGVEGKIEITDVVSVSVDADGKPTVEIRRTTYTREYTPGEANGFVQVLTELGALDLNGDFVVDVGGSTLATGGDRDSVYNPTADLRYVWQIGTDYTSGLTYSYTRDSFFTISALTVASRVSDMSLVSGPSITAVRRLPDGTYLSTATTVMPNPAPSTNNGLIVTLPQLTAANSTISDQPLVSASYSYQTDIQVVEGDTTKTCIGWTLCTVWSVKTDYSVTQKYTTITTHSLKADNPIGIHFIGQNTGAVSVTSASDVVLAGKITNVAGGVAIDVDGNLATVGSAATIEARNIDLDASGSIGGLNYSLPTGLPVVSNAPAIGVMLRGGALNAAAANGSVAIETRGTLVVGEVTAAGSVDAGAGKVTLTALGAIEGEDEDSLIQAKRVILLAGLNIGSTADGGQLQVNTGFTLDRAFGDPAVTPSLEINPSYGLSATAGGSIGIASSTWSDNADGTMLVDQVISIGGDVHLVAEGRILDNNPVETVDSRTYDQLLAYWESLGLLAEDTDRGIDGTLNAEKQAATIEGFERGRTQAYRQYWQLRGAQPDGGAVFDPSYVVTVDPSSPLHAALVQQYESAIRADNPALDDGAVADAVNARIAAYEASQTQLYRDLNTQVGGLTDGFDSDFNYVASIDEQAALTRGATWTERQLAFSLSAGALKTVTSTNPVVKAPNVSGRSVTIEAGLGIGETVGAGTPDVGVSIAATIDPRNLTLAQRIALASAERSDLQLSVQFEGSTVLIPLGKNRDEMTTTEQAAFDAVLDKTIPASDMTIVILTKRPLNFNAPDGVNIVVDEAPDGTTLDRGTAHLASRGNGVLGTITVPGETRIKVLGTIVNASNSAVNTGNLILEAAQGGIGAGINPLTDSPYPTLQLALRTGSTLTARAQNGISIDFTGDALIDTVYSPQDIKLTSEGSILNANGDLLINILGQNVVLEADGTIGTTLAALNVGNGLGGGITASASGLINLFGSAGHAFVIRQATSDTGSISLTAALEGVIDGDVTAPGRISLSSGLRMVVSGNGAIETYADMIEVSGASLKMINGATMMAQFGRVVVDVDGDAVVTGIESGVGLADAVSITAGGRIFAGTLEDRVDITAMATGAGVFLRAGLGIGDKTQANDKWQDGTGDIAGSANLITDTPNPLRLRTNTLDIAAAGSIYLETLTAITAATIVADPGDIYVWGSDDFHGNLISATGLVFFDINGNLTIDQLRAGSFDLSAAGTLILPDVEVATEAVLRAGSLIVNIKQVPEGPPRLKLTLTGYKGAVGNTAKVFVDAPAGLEIGDLFFTETELQTTARFVSILNAFVPGSLLLETPLQTLLWENRTPLPQYRQNVQLFQPGFAFNLTLDDFRTTTNAFVVKYDATAEIIDVLDGVPYPGASLVRDTIRSMYRQGSADGIDGGPGATESGGESEDDDDESLGGEQAQSGTPIGPYVAVGAFPALNLRAIP